MNHWARMLAELPALGQRLVARRHRVSLPRGCTVDERLRRLRRALCRAAGYAATSPLPTALRRQLQALSHPRGAVRLCPLP